jgi:hypothetical protein
LPDGGNSLSCHDNKLTDCLERIEEADLRRKQTEIRKLPLKEDSFSESYRNIDNIQWITDLSERPSGKLSETN